MKGVISSDGVGRRCRRSLVSVQSPGVAAQHIGNATAARFKEQRLLCFKGLGIGHVLASLEPGAEALACKARRAVAILAALGLLVLWLPSGGPRRVCPAPKLSDWRFHSRD